MLINVEHHDDNMNNSASMINSNINGNNINDNTNSSNNTSASQQQQPPQLRCPRCDSSNTKFCYYNNYSLLQPRYFCKSCRRYWTKGGTLRNVPIGGGCRKNKRLGHGRQRPTNSSSLPNHLLSGHGEHDPFSFPFTDHHLSTTSGANFSLLGHGTDPSDQHKAPPLLYFNHIPSPDHSPKPGFNLPSLHPIIPSDHVQGFFSRQLASYLPSTLASQYLSNVSSINPMHTAGYNHDHPASNLSAHQQTLIHPDSHGINATTSSHEPGFKAFSLAFDNPYNVTEEAHQQQGLPWPGSAGNTITKPLVHEQKLLTDNRIHQLNITRDMETQGNLMELGTSGLNSTAQLRPNLHGPKSEEGSWPDQRAHVYIASDQYAHNYWNHGGWHENMSSGYNPSADHHPLL